MNCIIPDIPMSPRLIRCSSDSSIEKNEEYDDIEDIIDKLVNDVCDQMTNKRKIFKYVRIISNQSLVYIFINMIYYIFSKYKLLKYKKIFKVKYICCKIDETVYKLHSTSIQLFDNCFQLNNNFKIPYEYMKTVNYENNYILLNLIPNERNITKIYIQTNDNKYIFSKISSNMNYHVRYHPLNQTAIKYFQKFHVKPLELY